MYPATFACEESASIPWERVRVRGMASRLIAITSIRANSAMAAGSRSGASMPMTTWFGRSFFISAGVGRWIRTITSDCEYRSEADTISAPASA